ncbi:TPA: hypothetical protein RQK02_004389 [Vibrio vulnificus]|nr:hypothetical protein [Vibrio vulnificus]HAS6359595.1 hypothetical protein [Vibrio vulnificus]HDY7608216.1 hypothetical protein [Vibrio vulnificus]HDY7699551.1 hypothetical protein [Vibrio vulnificus]
MTKVNAEQTKSTLMLNSVNAIFQEVKVSRNDIVASTIDHFILHHKARSTVFDNVTSFILKSRDGIDAADYMIGLVMDNFAAANKLVDLVKDDGAVETEYSTWGCLDMNDPNNIDVQSLFNSLINSLKISKSNPNKNAKTEGANLGVLSFVIEKKNKDDIEVYAIQRTTDVGKKVIDGKKKSFVRRGNEAYVVSDERYKINSDYDFFVLRQGASYYLVVSNFKHFVVTADYSEIQNRNVRVGFEGLVADGLITEDVKNKFDNYIASMGVREKNHFIRAIATGKHKSWSNLKDQQTKANANLPADRQWHMKFDSKDQLIFDGTKECVLEFVKFISHTIVQSVSDPSVFMDISNWTPASN